MQAIKMKNKTEIFFHIILPRGSFTHLGKPDSISNMQSLLDIIQAGGFVMYPLAICSLLTWAISLERLWSLRQTVSASRTLSKEILDSLRDNKRDVAQALCKKSDVPLARVFNDLLKNGNSNADHLPQQANRGRMALNQEYKRNLWILGTIGSATPFLGLFGTVVGILRAFKHIAESGETGFAVVATGISEALIATAAGIIVAVIAVAFYNFFQVRVSSLALESRLSIEEFVEMLQNRK